MLTAKRTEALLAEVGELYAIVLAIARGVGEHDEAMTATQRLVLIEVTAAGEVRPRELARMLHTTPATITRAVHVLEDAGLVVRKPDPEDGRCQLIVPTPRGQRWSSSRRELVASTLAQLPSSAAPARLVDDLARLNHALRVVIDDERPARGPLPAGDITR